jgi:DNA-binding Lrp family transcriptional regulator
MKNDQVKGIYGITGEYDLLIKMKFKDMKAFNDFLLAFREKYSKHISKTLTMVQTVKLKDL